LHHQAFQLSWISIFAAFFASFAAPPLLPVIRDNLDLTKPTSPPRPSPRSSAPPSRPS
jgi:hypothetical protein